MTPDDDIPDDVEDFREPLPPEDRIWRHPSEMQFDASTEPIGSSPQPAGTQGGHPGIWTATILSGVIGSLFTVGLVAAFGGLGMDIVERPVQTVTQQVAVPARGSTVATTSASDGPSVADIAEEVRPAMARVEVTTARGPGSGSGVMFRDDGHLLTNAHVVADADEITVVLDDGSEHSATLIGSDPATDIAVIKIDGESYRTVVLGSAQDLQVGQDAIAIGSPLGLDGGASVTKGVVSALGRRIDAPGGTTLHDMIQTDAPIAPGSSGGALLDSRGVVIGITTAIAVSEVGAEGLGFATPIDIARSVADDIITTGRAVHVWLGIRGTDVEGERAAELDVTGGALVIEVVGDSPAGAAGLEADDVIVAIGGDDVASMSGLVVALRTHDPGDEIELTVYRGSEQLTVVVELTERPDGI